ncbi:MAG: ABC transporter ATP-binding protein [Cyanobacteria bacterium CRU_2_1]|nr:ABC transporter ATP-binding protein [Cyanobacteria bacterium RU_5_0]NJR59690.1 ABC transporter ATP-binding protein [Cyanobacteria bacterium CRU_2_1]
MVTSASSGSTFSQAPVLDRTIPNQSIAIAARGIDMVFGSKNQPFQALKAVDLDIPAGAIELIMGPAGAGKTTLLLVLAGLLTPTAGQVTLLGKDITHMPRPELDQFRLDHIGIVFQDNNLLRSLTALENVEIAFNVRGIQGKAARQQAQALLEAVHLGDRADTLARQLSGGQQQRVGVARALAGNPRLLIVDEPTSALDFENGQIVSGLLHQFAKEKGSTVLVATHDPRMIPFADRITSLEDGIITGVKG